MITLGVAVDCLTTVRCANSTILDSLEATLTVIRRTSVQFHEFMRNFAFLSTQKGNYRNANTQFQPQFLMPKIFHPYPFCLILCAQRQTKSGKCLYQLGQSMRIPLQVFCALGSLSLRTYSGRKG